MMLAALLLACAPADLPPLPWEGEPPPVEHPDLAAIDGFSYWLQGPDLQALARGPAALLVIDPTADGSDATAFSAQEIRTLRASGAVVIAYLSLGEAEDYRGYWEADGEDWSAAPPSWLGPENPDWEGNFKVRYWEEGWQQLLVHNPGGHEQLGDAPARLDRLLEVGYDGVFLDVVDAFQFWGPEEDGGNGERPQAAQEMVTLLGRLADHARTVDPAFIVCQQNAADLPSPWLTSPLDAEALSTLWGAVDWISGEDVFFRGRKAQNNRYRPDPWAIEHLDLYRAQGKLVTVIDYLDPERPGFREEDVARLHQLAEARAWIATTGPRDLDRQP